MVFKDKKVPKHLIIRDEYGFRARPRFNLIKLIFWSLLLLSLSYVLILLKT